MLTNITNLVQSVPVPDDPNSFIVGALVVVMLALMGAVTLMVKTFIEIKKTNSAVNHKAPDEPTLYERSRHLSEDVGELRQMAEDIKTTVEDHGLRWRDFDRQWGAMPTGMANASELAITINKVLDQLDDMDVKLKDHVIWEMTEKYGPEWRGAYDKWLRKYTGKTIDDYNI